jgi:hypothetical protein
MGQAMRSESLARQTWVTKHSSGFFACGTVMKKWKLSESAICSICTTAEETPHHLFQCTDQRVTDLWVRKIRELKLWLSQHSTDPQLVTVVCRYLEGWRIGNDLATLEGGLQRYINIISSQNVLGWDSFLHGFITVEWRKAQEAYLKRMKNKLSIRRWTTSLIQKLWDTSWDFWEHRNGILHDIGTGDLVKRMDADIQHQFALGSRGVLASAVPLFAQGMESVLQSPLAVKQVWLKRVICGRERFRDSGGLQSMRNVMHRWIHQGQSNIHNR